MGGWVLKQVVAKPIILGQLSSMQCCTSFSASVFFVADSGSVKLGPPDCAAAIFATQKLELRGSGLGLGFRV